MRRRPAIRRPSRARAPLGARVLALYAVSAAAAAQQPSPPPARPVDPVAREFHRRTDQPTPREVLAWLQACAARAAAPARTDGTAPPRPPRPPGAGRWVVAVLVDAELDVEPHVLFGIDRKDVLVLASPGPVVRPEELALLEMAVREHRLALGIVLVRDGATTKAAKADSPAARALARRLPIRTASEAESAARQHARAQAEILCAASEELRAAARKTAWNAAVALLPQRGTELQWIAPWYTNPTPEELLRERESTAQTPTKAR
ncbi:MAG TPA: hypothetical protein VK081_08140 [Planctomycetota bacterium]|nr:hypothetical protein [Planctomycetota bacterium]